MWGWERDWGRSGEPPGQLRPCLLWPQPLCNAGTPSIALNAPTLRIPAPCPRCPDQSLFLVLA